MSIYFLASGEPPQTLGGKAGAWVRLHQAGLPVPAGFCIPADASITLASIRSALAVLTAATGARSVAVRSSGLGEDGEETALAGLFETALDVEVSADSVHSAALACRAAGSSARAVEALGQPARVAVLVQEMLSPTRSGVLFTRDPISGRAGAVVEVVKGHLRHLVDGTADAARVRLSEASKAVLSPVERDALASLAVQVEQVLGGPADIEWASLDGRIVALQARPITGLGPTIPEGITLLPVDDSASPRFPRAVLQHDKIELRLVAAQLGIGISAGYVALARGVSPAGIAEGAEHLRGWGEFIAVLLDPFDLDGEIHRHFGTGPSARHDLERFCEPVPEFAGGFAFLLKELQETASTGVGVRLPDGGVRIEAIHGHFITKGFEEPRVYILTPEGQVSSTAPGEQSVSVQLIGGKKVRQAVSAALTLSLEQLEVVRRATLLLAERYPDAGIEFGFTPTGEFFLVDLYRSASVLPPDRANVLSEGRVVGRVRILDVPEDAIEASIERHMHSRPTESTQQNAEIEILVVSRPFHVLDQLIYRAPPGTLGFICDGGALLCHLAVVMRERGVPGLVLRGATTSFSDGEQVILDTRRGSVSPITRI